MGIDIGKFLKNPEYDITITTYRDIFQIEAFERDRFGEEYKKLSAAIVMSKIDMQKMGLKKGDRVKLSNNYGSVVVEVKETKRDETGGLVFMVNGPWANSLAGSDTEGGIPEFKMIRAKISLTNEDVTSLEKIFVGFYK